METADIEAIQVHFCVLLYTFMYTFVHSKREVLVVSLLTVTNIIMMTCGRELYDTGFICFLAFFCTSSFMCSDSFLFLLSTLRYEKLEGLDMVYRK